MQNWSSRNDDSNNEKTNHVPLEAELVERSSVTTAGEDDSQRWSDAEGEQHELALLSQAHQAIAQVQGLDEIKNIRDKAEAVRKYAQSVGMGLDLQNYAAEVKLRAERKAGELLAQLQLHGGDRKTQKADARPKLEDLGITKDQSSRWQLTAAISDREFEKYVAQTKVGHGEVTTAGLLRVAKRMVAKRRQKDKQRRDRANGSELQSAVVPVKSLNELVQQGIEFACIYADPMASRAGIEPQIFLERLSSLPVEQVAAENAHLHLWMPEEHLFESIRLMSAWGFRFAGGFVWIKSKGPSGNYWRPSHEHLLLGVRGSLPFRDKSKASWLRAARSAQDDKPEGVRKLIERVSPGPFLELFGKKGIEGWTVYQSDLVASEPPGN